MIPEGLNSMTGITCTNALNEAAEDSVLREKNFLSECVRIIGTG